MLRDSIFIQDKFGLSLFYRVDQYLMLLNSVSIQDKFGLSFFQIERLYSVIINLVFLQSILNLAFLHEKDYLLTTNNLEIFHNRDILPTIIDLEIFHRINSFFMSNNLYLHLENQKISLGHTTMLSIPRPAYSLWTNLS